MGLIWDFFVIITITLLILGLMLQGLLPLQFGAIALVLLIAFRAIGRGRGGSLSRAVRTVFTIGLPITALLIFVTTYGQGDPKQMMAIIGGLGALFIVLFGLYIMVRALFPRA